MNRIEEKVEMRISVEMKGDSNKWETFTRKDMKKKVGFLAVMEDE